MARGTKKGADHPRMLLTEQMQNEICNLIESGQTVQGALTVCGIKRNTYRGWRKHARAGKEPFASFIERVEVSKQRLKGLLLERIINGRRGKGEHDITGAMWYLERIFADEFGSRQQIEIRAATLADSQVEKLIDALMESLSDGARDELLDAWDRIRTHSDSAGAVEGEAAGTVH